MNIETNIVREFNERLIEFLDYLEQITGNQIQCDIDKVRVYMGANKLGPLTMFTQFVYPYKKYVDRKDTSYFLKNNIVDGNETLTPIEVLLKKIWGVLDAKNRGICINYIQLLLNVSDKLIVYHTARGHIDYTVLSELIKLEIVENRSMRTLIQLIITEKYLDANEALNSILGTAVSNIKNPGQ